MIKYVQSIKSYSSLNIQTIKFFSLQSNKTTLLKNTYLKQNIYPKLIVTFVNLETNASE